MLHMIPQSTAQVEPLSLIKHAKPPEDWRTQLREAYRTPQQLLNALGFSEAQQAKLIADDQGFSTLVPKAFAQKMKPQDPTDPLLLQVLPRFEEAIKHPEFNDDPLQEAQLTLSLGWCTNTKGEPY